MIPRNPRICVALLVCSLIVILLGCGATVSTPVSSGTNVVPPGTIKHVVVIFQENVSFDHYFGTYPTALNLHGESPFKALPRTPAIDGLSQSLLTNNPNASNTRNGAGATNPFRL